MCVSLLLGFSAVFCDDDKKNLLLKKLGILPLDPIHGYLAVTTIEFNRTFSQVNVLKVAA